MASTDPDPDPDPGFSWASMKEFNASREASTPSREKVRLIFANLVDPDPKFLSLRLVDESSGCSARNRTGSYSTLWTFPNAPLSYTATQLKFNWVQSPVSISSKFSSHNTVSIYSNSLSNHVALTFLLLDFIGSYICMG
jgi:hypothetical protein